MNFEFEREIGFINSQPSLAECLTSFPAVLESFQTSSIKESTVIPPPFEHTIPSLSPCAASQPRPAARSQHNRRSPITNGIQAHRGGAAQQQPCPPGQPPTAAAAATVAAAAAAAAAAGASAGPLAPEFPWMKEKKSSKKCTKSGGSAGGGPGSGGGGGGGGGGGAVITPASSSPSPTASGYPSTAIESPTGRYTLGMLASMQECVRACMCVCVYTVYVYMSESETRACTHTGRCFNFTVFLSTPFFITSHFAFDARPTPTHSHHLSQVRVRAEFL